MPRLDMPSASRVSTSRSRAELVKRIGPAPAGEEPGHNRRVDDCLAVGEAAKGVDQVRDVKDAFFEQVADPFGTFLKQSHRVVRFDVLGQDQHADAGVAGTDLLSGDESLICMGGRHADVDDGCVWRCLSDGSQQGGAVADLAGHVDSRLGEQAGNALAGEHDVVGYDYPHGISARYASGPLVRWPPSAPTRSASATIGEFKSEPVTVMVTTSQPPSWVMFTVA
jgi:hypothetical protein